VELYFNSSLTGKETPEITQYKQLNPGFPHETTADQCFSESQLESYQGLGYFIACEALRPEAVLNDWGIAQPCAL
jgi:hypothetical protein